MPMNAAALLVFLGGAALSAAARVPAVIDLGEGPASVFLTAASPRNLEFQRLPQANRIRVARADVVALYIYEPTPYREAKEHYERRDYATARKLFAECREAFERLEALPGNPSTLAAFHELECCRKMGDLAALKEGADRFDSKSLVQPAQRRQLELYPLWDAVRTRDWARVARLTGKLRGRPDWDRPHVVQIRYCEGLALEALGRPREALNAYQAALTADAAASVELARRAILGSLRVLRSDPEVKVAMTWWGSDREDRQSSGARLLREAVSLCDLWERALGRGEPLPAEFASFRAYRRPVPGLG